MQSTTLRAFTGSRPVVAGQSTISHIYARKPLFRSLTERRFLPIDTYPGIVAFAETLLGKAVLLALFASIFWPLTRLWLPATAAAGACAYSGRYRSRVVTLGTLGILVLYYIYRPHGQFISPYWIDWSAPYQLALIEGIQRHTVFQLNWLMVLLVFLLSSIAMQLVRRFPEHPMARRPILTLHAAFLFLVLLAASGFLHGMPLVALWSFIVTLGAYFWFVCYALTDQRLKDGSPPLVQLGVFHPFWGSSTTPIGKGAGYLRKIEAKTSKDLAVTQLKGLKLLMWVWVLKLIMHFFRAFALGLLNIPEFEQIFTRQMASHPYPWYVCWAALLYKFFYGMLYLAIWGDTAVACGRLAGYRMLRNSWRPLSSTTLADFWNRYYYYFKELLVNIFFFPTFFRYFKHNTRARIFFATFMAAAVGNLIFHFVREIGSVPQLGLRRTALGLQTYAFYCAVLAISIGISQMRSHRKSADAGWLRRRILPSLGVMLFYCLLEVFNVDTYTQYSLKDHFALLFHLFGLNV